MTGRYYFSLIRAQQEEYWPCSISLQQSLASTQVSNCSRCWIVLRFLPSLKVGEKDSLKGLPVGFSKWLFWPLLLQLPTICPHLWGWLLITSTGLTMSDRLHTSIYLEAVQPCTNFYQKLFWNKIINRFRDKNNVKAE